MERREKEKKTRKPKRREEGMKPKGEDKTEGSKQSGNYKY